MKKCPTCMQVSTMNFPYSICKQCCCHTCTCTVPADGSLPEACNRCDKSPQQACENIDGTCHYACGRIGEGT